MAKKKSFFSSLFSSFFSVMVRLVPFLFDTIFLAIRFFFKTIASVFISTVKQTESQIKKTEITYKKPKTSAIYAPFVVLKTINGSFVSFEEKILKSRSTIGLIIGARGSGKSALGMRLLENIRSKSSRKVCAMGFSDETIPSWIKNIEKIDDAPNNSFILIDEGGILFSSRETLSNANKILSDFLLIARHKDLSILFISQNSANLEINAIRQADYLLLRKSSLLQKDFERKKIKEVYEEAEKHFNDFSTSDNILTYVYSDLFRGYIKNELPSFWTEKTSKAFKNFKN